MIAAIAIASALAVLGVTLWFAERRAEVNGEQWMRRGQDGGK